MVEESPCESDNFSLWTLLDFIPSPIFFKDAEGRYQCVNQLLADMIMGLPKDAIVGRKVTDLCGKIPADLAEIYHAKDLELMKQGGVQVYESEVLCADGKRRFFEFHKAVVKDQDGSCLGLVGIMMDLSARHSLEREALANEKMRAAIQTAGAASHELSQPLQIITGTIELCALEPEIPPQIKQHLKTMTQAALNAKGILNKLQNLRSFHTTEYKHTSTTQILDLDESVDG
ncbi:MAG: PAS domain-containing protein [Desulfarculus sp.]|nr:PAS domain-containing protein [Pseudomonadota bacterium]MBU4598389.1 PAS domain-containing protein [Pseudomonadota bacterium]MBV1717163.1 PAS domain-containing protein [Desulfarculus sp.]MBV1739501.1 PAS domain-containing protein [Desulfarculus sp.]MBV1750919.1 PAS domain-containing protein [Desulfarculus sp.]